MARAGRECKGRAAAAAARAGRSGAGRERAQGGERVGKRVAVVIFSERRGGDGEADRIERKESLLDEDFRATILNLPRQIDLARPLEML